MILCPLRPQLKNVTSEDIAASLYYLHLNSDEDLDYDEAEVPSPVSVTAKSLPRKPVSGGSTSDSTEISSSQPHESGKSLGDPQPPQIPSWKEALPDENAKPLLSKSASISRKPLGTLSLKSELSVRRKPLPSLSGAENKPPNPTPQPESNPEPESVKVPSSSREHFNVPSGSSNISDLEARKPFYITVIRRDPSSGAQWNIAKIIGAPVSKRSSGAFAKNVYYDITVHITTPGYNSFRDSPSGLRQSLDQQTRNPVEAQSTLPSHAIRGFERQIRMEWATPWSEILKQQKHTFSETGSISNVKNQSTHLLDLSSDSEPSRAKGYCFTSPWNGTCRFSTGGAGRSLSLKHTLPLPISSTSSGFSQPNATVEVSELRFNLPNLNIFDRERFNAVAGKISHKVSDVSSPGRTSPTRTVPSEKPATSNRASMSRINTKIKQHLRYLSHDSSEDNLPKARPDQTFPTAKSSSEERGSDISPRPSSQFPDLRAADTEARDPFDLSLGQEKAGGGNRGKRAKLGKLIINNEGLKMLDLVVAANMGVWWSVWNPS